MAPARPIRNLSCEESFRSAAGKVIWTRFEEMMSFREAAVAGEDIEGIHDMRVGSRRLRAAVEVFCDVFPQRDLRRSLDAVKALADALGRVRDTDVMIERLRADMRGRTASQRQVLAEICQELQQQRQEARVELERLLDRWDRDEVSRHFLALIAKETM